MPMGCVLSLSTSTFFGWISPLEFMVHSIHSYSRTTKRSACHRNPRSSGATTTCCCAFLLRRLGALSSLCIVAVSISNRTLGKIWHIAQFLKCCENVTVDFFGTFKEIFLILAVFAKSCTRCQFCFETIKVILNLCQFSVSPLNPICVMGTSASAFVFMVVVTGIWVVVTFTVRFITGTRAISKRVFCDMTTTDACP